MADEDHMDDLELYEDEPMTSVRASAFSGNQLVIQNMDDLERKRQKRRRKRRKRLERLGKIAVCLCCLGSILAIVLTIVLTKTAIAVTTPPPPSPAPTPMPAIPTYKPTPAHPTIKVPGRPTSKPPSMSVPTIRPAAPPTAVPTFSIKDSYTLVAKQDTYIYTKGALKTYTFGREETLLVQTGFRLNDASPNAIALLIFDTSSIPDFSVLTGQDRKATLKLQHRPLDRSDRNRDAAPITVARMDSTPVRIESISGSDFTLPKTWDGPTVNVEVDATEVSIDITDIYFNTDFDSENQLFLMLQTRGQQQEVGDQFFSRESDTPPQLILTGLSS